MLSSLQTEDHDTEKISIPFFFVFQNAEQETEMDIIVLKVRNA